MELDIDVSLSYRLGPEKTALLAVEAAEAPGQEVVQEYFDLPDAAVSEFAGEWGIGRRAWVRSDHQHMCLRYRARAKVSRAPVSLSGLSEAPLPELPVAQVTFLRPSRYCQSDLMDRIATDRFSGLRGGDKIEAMLEWIADTFVYDPFQSTGETTALDTLSSRRGVCRDYAHVLCCLARAAQIPARYVSAYGLSVDPPDFHAVVQVWLEGRWHMVDPSGMCDAQELVVIGVGRDAADVPFMETPDEAQFVDQRVQVSAA